MTKTIEELIAASSLGTPEAVAIRESADPTHVAEIMRRVAEREKAEVSHEEIQALRARCMPQRFDELIWFGENYSLRDVKRDTARVLNALEEIRYERAQMRIDQDSISQACERAHAYISNHFTLGLHKGCGGVVELVDMAARCKTCGTQDWGEDCGPYDADLFDKIENVSSVQARCVTAERELERWRHDVTIEGDFVCPDSLALAEMTKRAELAEQRLEVLAPVLVHVARGALLDEIMDADDRTASAWRQAKVKLEALK